MACKELGWSEIPATVRDIDSKLTGAAWDLACLRIEIAENKGRKDFNPSEIYKSSREMERLIALEAKERILAGVKSDDPVDHDPQGESKTRDKVAKEYGITGRTLSSIKKVMESGNPEAIKVMDEKSVNAGLKLLNPSKPDEKYAARSG